MVYEQHSDPFKQKKIKLHSKHHSWMLHTWQVPDSFLPLPAITCQWTLSWNT